MILITPLDFATTYEEWIYFFIYSPLAYFLYTGLVLGALIENGRKNRPRTIDVYIGDRIGDELHIDTVKQVRKGTTTVKDKKGFLYPLDTAVSTLHMRHLIWESPVVIIDRAYASAIQGIRTKYEQMDNRTDEDLAKMQNEIEAAKTKNKPLTNVKLNINPIFKISAWKLYKWIEGVMLDASYQAAVSGSKITSKLPLIMLLAGIASGGMFGFILADNLGVTNHYITETTTIQPSCGLEFTYTYSSLVQSFNRSATYTTLTTSSCITGVSGNPSSTLTTDSTSTTSSINSCATLNCTSSTSSVATIVNESVFNNGTTVTLYSNGTAITHTGS